MNLMFQLFEQHYQIFDFLIILIFVLTPKISHYFLIIERLMILSEWELPNIFEGHLK